MNTHRGYIVPVMFILVLLLFAGFFTFTDPGPDPQEMPTMTITNVSSRDQGQATLSPVGNESSEEGDSGGAAQEASLEARVGAEIQD